MIRRLHSQARGGDYNRSRCDIPPSYLSKLVGGGVQPGVGGGSCRGSGGVGLARGQGGVQLGVRGGGVRVSPRVRVTGLVEPVLVL